MFRPLYANLILKKLKNDTIFSLHATRLNYSVTVPLTSIS